MASLYLCNVTGDGTSPDTAFRPDFPSQFACLMIDQARRKALVLSPDDAATGTGVTRLVQAASLAALRTKAATTNPSSAARTALNTWLTNGGYQPLTAAQVTWLDCIHYAAHQVDPAADLNATG